MHLKISLHKYGVKYAAAVLCCAVISCRVFFFPAMAGEEETPSPKLNAQSAVLMDAATGRVLYGKEEETVRPMASTTKIMTCILALENCGLDEEVEISSYAAGQPKVHLGAPAGRRFRLGDILYSLMLESHNDSAVVVAEHVAGSTEEFAAMMNEKAREIGCENTWFITPNGLDAQEVSEGGEIKIHGTTAEDLAAIMSYCTWKSPKSGEFLTITQTQNYYFTDLEGKGNYSCVNHNALLTMMDGVVSGKTGFTGGAGYCYVGALEDGGRKYVIALLGCGWPPHKTYKWSDARQLFKYGLENYENRPLERKAGLNPVPVLGGIPLDGSIGGEARTKLTAPAEDDGQLPCVLMKEGEQIKVTAHVPSFLTAPVYAGQQAGKLIYTLDGVQVYWEPVFAAETVNKIDLEWCLREMARRFFLQESPIST